MDRSVLHIGSIRALLAADVISTTGAQMTWVALPWFVLTTSGSATRMSLVISAEAIGLAVMAFVSVRLLDRFGSRGTMLICDALRGPLTLAIPILHWTGDLSFGVLVAVAFGIGALTAPYFPAERMIVPELIGEDERVVSQASALFQASRRLTLLLGAPAAGVLIGVMGAPAVLLVDAVTYLVAVALVAAFVPATPRVEADEESRSLRAGLRWVSRDPLVRAWRFGLIVGDAAWQAIFIALPVLVVARYDAEPRIVGILFAAFAVGAVAGNAISYRLVKKVDGLSQIARVALGQALPLWLLVLEVPAPVAVAVLGASGFANGLINPSLHAIITLRIPPRLRASVLTSLMTVHALAMPVGILGAGPLLDAFGVAPVFALCAGVQTVVMAVVALAAVRGRPSAPRARSPSRTALRTPPAGSRSPLRRRAST